LNVDGFISSLWCASNKAPHTLQSGRRQLVPCFYQHIRDDADLIFRNLLVSTSRIGIEIADKNVFSATMALA
jgi:hypothetical protein